MSEVNDSPAEAPARDYRKTLFLPETEFPMRAGLPKREPDILEKWAKLDLHGQLRKAAEGRDKFILHDGPPYANGNIHIGTGLNKILKDILSRSQGMLGKDANYVPGWDCHGLPIEWKIEEQYRAKGRDKDAVPINEFRKECRDFAAGWIDIQREEFKRLGVVGDWDNPYLTMSYDAEAQIAREIMKFAMNGGLYRGSKPVMWSVVEKTALAEAEVEYHDHESDTVWVKFPVIDAPGAFAGASVLIWTTTPWTIPGNRAISFSSRISYGLYEVTAAPDDNWARTGEKLILADALAEDVFSQARVDAFERRQSVSADELAALICAHPLRNAGLGGYGFDVPLLDGGHVTDDAGTGFVHTAPGHGREDFEIWMESGPALKGRGIDTAIPFTVAADGTFTADAPGFTGAAVLKPNGKKGDANKAVIDALVDAGMLLARGRLKHQYPHSWRSKAPVIFRNTPQWFIAMDEPLGSPLPGGERSDSAMPETGDGNQRIERSEPPHPSPTAPTSPRRGEVKAGSTLRQRALTAIDATRFVPAAGQNRLRAMIEQRPDWVISRQRAWGVPITVFTNEKTGDVIPNASWNGSGELQDRIADAFEAEGADAWFADGAKARFLGGLVENPDDWEQVTDILDVWFDSGSTHAFVLEKREDLRCVRPHEGGNDRIVYLEGSDQHRGWFHSSLLESCGTRGHAPYDVVVTHGFTMAEDGRKMSKSLGNQVFPQDVIAQNGADILRLWVASTDYGEDQRIGPEIIKSTVDAYRKLRNTLRWMLGSLAHYDESLRVAADEMPELERYMLHRLAELDARVRTAYEDFDFRDIYSALFNFATIDLSAFYFDIRKDALYCDAPSSLRRRAALTVLDEIFSRLTAWMAPILVFTMEEVWASRFGEDADSVHVRTFPETPDGWRDDALARKWSRIRKVRRVVTGALEIERREKRIGSSLEAAPAIHVTDADLLAALDGVDLAEIAITSGARLSSDPGPDDAFTLEDVAGVSVVPELATGRKCARSWKILDEVGSDPDYPDLTQRDAAAMREIEAAAGSGSGTGRAAGDPG